MLQVGRIGFLGGGKIAQAMVKGFIAAGLTKAESVTVSVHPADEPNLKLLQEIGTNAIFENLAVVEQSDIVFIAVKPNVVSQALLDVRRSSDDKLFISLAMGISLNEIQKNLSQNARLVRAMPNTPIAVREGCSVFVRGQNATENDAKLTKKIFEALGTCEEVAEHLLDPITALSGSGPAYIFVLIEALADGAVKMGLPRDLAYRLAAQTVLGSGKYVRDSNRHPAMLKDDVTSPGGSTAAGLSHLEKSNFRAAAAGAIEMATLQCRKVSNKN